MNGLSACIEREQKSDILKKRGKEAGLTEVKYRKCSIHVTRNGRVDLNLTPVKSFDSHIFDSNIGRSLKKGLQKLLRRKVLIEAHAKQMLELNDH